MLPRSMRYLVAPYAIGAALLMGAFGCGGNRTDLLPPQTSTTPSVKFAPRIDLSTGGTLAGSVALADFNSDGKLDIAISNFASNTISVFLSTGNGTFQPPVLTAVQIPNGLGPIVAGDFNENGNPDLLTATISGPQADIILLGNGDGTFTQSGSIPDSFGFLQGQAVDLDRDNHLDLISGGNGNMAVALGKGDGTFNPVTYLGNGPMPNTYFGIAVADANGDNKLDIVGVNYGYSTGDVVFFRGNGDGSFQPPTSSPTTLTGPSSVSAADFNGDGKLDIVVGYSPGSASVVLGNGDGTFQLATQTTVYAAFGQGSGLTVRAADLNQDGKPDVLVADYTAGVFAIALNKGAGSFLPFTAYTYTIAPGLNDMAVADLNGDGWPDVVLVNGTTNQISIFLSQK